jgi:hypothetical protein
VLELRDTSSLQCWSGANTLLVACDYLDMGDVALSESTLTLISGANWSSHTSVERGSGLSARDHRQLRVDFCGFVGNAAANCILLGRRLADAAATCVGIVNNTCASSDAFFPGLVSVSSSVVADRCVFAGNRADVLLGSYSDVVNVTLFGCLFDAVTISTTNSLRIVASGCAFGIAEPIVPACVAETRWRSRTPWRTPALTWTPGQTKRATPRATVERSPSAHRSPTASNSTAGGGSSGGSGRVVAKLSVGGLVGIIVGSLVFGALVCFIVLICCRKRPTPQEAPLDVRSKGF